MEHVSPLRLMYVSLGIAGFFWPVASQVLGAWIVFILVFGKPKGVGNDRKK